MVSTRHHPRQFPEPVTPTSRSTRTTPRTTPTKSKYASKDFKAIESADDDDDNSSSSTATAAASRGALSRRRRKSKSSAYVHTLDPIILLWLAVSLPLVAWDIGYVLLRPHSMPGGSLHSPVWSPYALYGEVDHVYGFPAWEKGIGFTAAQSALNLAETLMYAYYLAIVAVRGRGTGWLARLWAQTFSPTNHRSSSSSSSNNRKVAVTGQGVAFAVIVAHAAAVMTLSKTALYWLNEYFSNFENIGHNSLSTLFWLWILPNGAWLVVPSWMIYVLGSEIVAALNESGV